MAADGSLKIGKVWNIEIGLHWTFIMLILLVLLVGNEYLIAVFAMLFVCVFIHELAHSKAAIANKVRVNSIVISPLGGATMIDDSEIDPRTELHIAAAGPIMSFLLGGVFGIMATLSPLGITTFVLQTMFEINIGLGVLNVLPAFPLDGGRVFKSWLKRRRDEIEATEITFNASKLIAALFVLLPLVYLYFLKASLEYKVFDFAIFAFVGFFVYGGAAAEKQLAAVRVGTRGLTIRNAASERFMFVDIGMNADTLYRKVESSGTSVVISKVDGKFVLIDLFGRRPQSSGIPDLAVSIPQFSQSTGMIDALRKMESMNVGIGIVVKGGKPVGVVSAQHLNALISLHLMSRRRHAEQPHA